MSAELELTDWRRTVAELYAAVRAQPSPERGHACGQCVCNINRYV